MADVVDESRCFTQVWVGSHAQSYSLCYLCDFQRVGKARPKKVALIRSKKLGFSLQAPKRGTVDYPGSIDLEIVSLIVGFWLIRITSLVISIDVNYRLEAHYVSC